MLLPRSQLSPCGTTGGLRVGLLGLLAALCLATLPALTGAAPTRYRSCSHPSGFARGFAQQVRVHRTSCARGRSVTSAYVDYGFNHPTDRTRHLVIKSFRCSSVNARLRNDPNGHSRVTCVHKSARVQFLEGP